MKASVIIPIVLTFFSCKGGDVSIILPKNGEIILSTAEKFNAIYPLKYFQYEGFKGNYNDPYLKSFSLIWAKKTIEKKVLSMVISQSEVDLVFKEKIKGIRFDKIPEEIISTEDLCLHIRNLYPDTNAIKIESIKREGDTIQKKYALIHENTGKTICIINHVEEGIPGTFVIFEG